MANLSALSHTEGINPIFKDGFVIFILYPVSLNTVCSIKPTLLGKLTIAGIPK